MKTQEAVLIFDRVCAGYGKLQVLDALSFELGRGQVLGIIGPNGSGKTTMLNVLTGLLRPDSGRIILDGEDITRLTVDARCRRGIGRTFQIPRPFSRLSVFENVLAAAAYGRGLSLRSASEPARDVLRLTGLQDKAELPSGKLTLLDRKRLEIARAIAARPKLLLLDEVAAGLTGGEVEDVVRIVSGLQDAGFSVLWIEHIMEALTGAADSVMCLAEGKNAWMGSPAEVRTSPEVQTLYFGSETDGAQHAEG